MMMSALENPASQPTFGYPASRSGSSEIPPADSLLPTGPRPESGASPAPAPERYRVQPLLSEPTPEEARTGVSVLPAAVGGAVSGAAIGIVVGYSVGQVGMIPVFGAIMITASFCSIGGMLGAMVGSLLAQSGPGGVSRIGGLFTGAVVGGVVSAILGLLFPDIGPALCGAVGALSAGLGSWMGMGR